jgi:DNA-binding XRE family transcriptional regulator
MLQAEELLTQADFARRVGVSRAAVNQWRSKGILGEEAFSKPDKKGKLIVAIALEHVRQNRNLGQSMGNGLHVQTTQIPNLEMRSEQGDAPAASGADQLSLGCDEDCANASGSDQEKISRDDAGGMFDGNTVALSVEDQIKRARLEEQKRKNRLGAAEEALQQGRLVAADDARAEMMRIASMMMQVFEGALPDLAAQVAGRFDVPQRDVLHSLRAEFKKVRASVAKRESLSAARADPERPVSLDVEE